MQAAAMRASVPAGGRWFLDSPGMALSPSAVPASKLLHRPAADQPGRWAAGIPQDCRHPGSTRASGQVRQGARESAGFDPGFVRSRVAGSIGGRASPGRANAGRPRRATEDTGLDGRQLHGCFSQPRAVRRGRWFERRPRARRLRRGRRRVPGARSRRAPRRVSRVGGAAPGGSGRGHGRSEPLRADRPSGRREPALLPGLLQLEPDRRVPPVRVREPGRRRRGDPDALRPGPVLPRARPRQGAGHDRRDALAPRPALLLRGGGEDGEPLDRPRPGRARDVRRVRGRVAPLGEHLPADPVQRHRPVRKRP